MAKSKRPMTWNSGSIIVLLVGVGFVVGGAVLTWNEYQLGTKGMLTNGLVTKYEKRGRSSHYTITYPFQGQMVSAQVTPSMFSGLDVGKTVEIIYDPNDSQSINVNKFWHRYFYQTLAFGLGGFMLCVLPLMLWPSDDDWLQNYSVKLTQQAGKQRLRPADQLVLAIWYFNLAVGSRPKAAIASYFETHGLDGWGELKDLWNREKVPSLAPVIEEIDGLIANTDPVKTLQAESPKIEQFYLSHRPAILSELRDYATAEETDKE